MQEAHAKPTELPTLSRYGLALVLVAAALVLSLGLEKPFGNPFWFFFSVAVIVTTWIAGRGPGWVAVGMSTVAVLYYFVPPVRSFTVKPRDVPFFLTFVACEAVANWLISWRKETEDGLRRTRDELEMRVGERTAELKEANEALRNRIEEQRQTEEALQITRTELARVSRITTIGELTASIAHEVNQPLAAVVANADACVAWLTRADPDFAEARAAAERTTQGATRASEVISRIRSLINKTAPQRARVQLNDVIRETVALTEGQASRNDISFVLELVPGLPTVLGDGIQLQQVTLNLIMNGMEAMTTVTARPRQLTIRSRADDDQVSVSVEDSGIGVKVEFLPKLFDPFFTTRAQGIGMGLAISRSIVEAHSGRLWAESTVDKGSVFHLTLPRGEDSVA